MNQTNIYGITKRSDEFNQRRQRLLNMTKQIDTIDENNTNSILTKIQELKNEPESIIKLNEYSDIMDTKINQLQKIKQVILDKLELITVSSCKNNIILQFDVTNLGEFDGVLKYDVIKDDSSSTISTVKILLDDIDVSKIRIIDSTKRSCRLVMKHPNSTVVIYNISFDLNNVDSDTNIVMCTYYVSRS